MAADGAKFDVSVLFVLLLVFVFVFGDFEARAVLAALSADAVLVFPQGKAGFKDRLCRRYRQRKVK